MSEPTKNGTGDRDGTGQGGSAGGSTPDEPERSDPTAPIWSDPTASLPEPPHAPHASPAPPPVAPGAPPAAPYGVPGGAPGPYGEQPSPSEPANPYAYDKDAAPTPWAAQQQGAPYPAYGQQPYGVQQGYARQWGATSGKATAVLVLGIASIVLACCLGAGVIPAVIALVLAPGAKREIVASGGALTGLGQVKAGQITSIIALVLTVLGAVLVGVLIASGAFNGPSSDFSGTF
jgi:hypothetical protein